MEPLSTSRSKRVRQDIITGEDDLSRPKKRTRSQPNPSSHGENLDEPPSSLKPTRPNSNPRHHRNQYRVNKHQSGKKSKSDRKNNPSSRIHSLRKQLNGSVESTLPATIRQEKERELAGLLMDQERSRMRQTTKKNISKYHMVRFVERQKATRLLKRLRKQKKQLEGVDVKQDIRQRLETLEQRIHDTEVTLNYTIYCPLGAKYISIFAHDPANSTKRKVTSDKTQEEDSQNDLSESETTDQKPPLWHQVEKIMNETSHNESEREKQLTALREGQKNNTQPASGGNVNEITQPKKSKHKSANTTRQTLKNDRIAQNGGDVDSSDDIQQATTRDDRIQKPRIKESHTSRSRNIDQNERHKVSDDNDDDDNDEDLSDGGFFEK